MPAFLLKEKKIKTKKKEGSWKWDEEAFYIQWAEPELAERRYKTFHTAESPRTRKAESVQQIISMSLFRQMILIPLLLGLLNPYPDNWLMSKNLWGEQKELGGK